MVSVETLARYVINLFREQMENLESDEFDVTPLKLQKLLYYCQGYALALTGKPLFSDPIEAWKYGPVVESVYQTYKKYGSCPIPLDQVESVKDFDNVAASIARVVVEEKGRLSGIALAKATHDEAPWKDAYQGVYTNESISHEAMKNFFSRVIAQKEEAEDEEDSLWASAGETLTDADWEAVFETV